MKKFILQDECFSAYWDFHGIVQYSICRFVHNLVWIENWYVEPVGGMIDEYVGGCSTYLLHIQNASNVQFYHIHHKNYLPHTM
jgi:hypothetical protein